MQGEQDTAILEAGAAKLGLKLDDTALARFKTYHAVLADWNQRINLTSITAWDAAQRVHFLDSLTIASLLLKQPALQRGRMIDIGTGAGFPALPLKIVFPQLYCTLLDATGKKTRFLEVLCEELKVTGIQIVNGRAEEMAQLPSLREGFDLVVARALAPMPVLAELTLPFAKVGGYVVAQKKGNFQAELANAAFAIRTLGGTLEGVEEVTLPEIGDTRSLVVLRKVARTPKQYPRRSGMPSNQPLLAAGSGPASGQAATGRNG